MNKKVSTLLTASLLMAGPVFGSLFAQKLANTTVAIDKASKAEGKQYVLVSTHYGQLPGTSKNGQNTYVTAEKDGSNWNFKLEVASSLNKKVIWTVKAQKSPFSSDSIYSFENPTYGTFKVKYGADNKKEATSFVLNNNPGQTRADGSRALIWDENGWLSVGDEGVANSKAISVPFPSNAAQYFVLQEVLTDDVTDEDLNSFFNKKGFNLAVKYDSKLGKLAENIFGGDSRVYAFEVKKANCADTKNWDDNKNAYKLSSVGANGKDLYIPEGMYFFTNRVLIDAAAEIKAENIDWLASDFITVSPRETVETTVDNRVKGQGFKLVSVKGSEFIYDENTSEFKVADSPIWNACFTVSDNYSAYPYAINLKNFYYQKSAKDAATDKLEKTSIGLDVLAFDADDTQYLTSVPGATEYIFKFSDSALKDGKELLKTTKEAAVYNLQFVAGKSEDQEKLVGKYLTVATDGSKFEWVAKPYDITKVENPEFQYTITRVFDEDETDDVEKYTIIEFTNRETNESFMAKLFPEPSYGENCYSLAFVKNEKGESLGKDFEVDPLKVNNNNYAVEYYLDENNQPINNVKVSEDVIVKLIPAKVDEYAGFLNVDDGTVRTIRFARDKFDTSYQWYTNVKKTVNGTTVTYSLDDKFVEENYDAAQFVLVKSDKPYTIARTFVYNNTTTEDVDDVPNGDKLSAYTYQLMYVADGTTSKWGLKDNGDLELANSNYTNYFVRENSDGSVSFFDSYSKTFSGKMVTLPSECNSVQVELDNTDKDKVEYVTTGNFTEIYKPTFLDTEIRTYLEGEAPTFSWAGENGHVTLRNNTTGVTGNYISMNDSREGILVSNDADVFYLHATDEKAVVPSFFISKGNGEGSNAASERMFMFNPVDSVNYPVNMDYDPNYQLAKQKTKAIFKAGTLNEDYTKLNTWIKGENRDVAEEADNNGVWGGLNRFKFQIIETADRDGNYNVRQVAATKDGETAYLASTNEKLYFTEDKALAMTIHVDEVEAPTSNEGVAASEVKVVAQDGAVVVKNAAGKNVVVSTILGQVVANEVLTSDNATINVPAGIVVVAVEGESFKVNVK